MSPPSPTRSPEAPRVFISYRRSDSAGYADHLYQSLKRPIGADNLFMDIDSLDAGEDYVAKIETTVAAADVVLVLIGPHWLAATDGAGRRRIDQPTDWVRLEIETSLRRDDVAVIPLLVQGVSMPREDELPPSIAHLARRNAFVVGPRLSDHVKPLVAAIRRAAERVRPAAPTPTPPNPTLPNPTPPNPTPPAPTRPRPGRGAQAGIRSVVQTNIRLAHEGAVVAVAFAGSDTFVATASADRTARSWGLDPMIEHRRWTIRDEPVDVDATADHMVVASDNQVQVFALADGAVIETLDTLHARSVAFVAGARVVVTHRDGSVGAIRVKVPEPATPARLVASRRSDGVVRIFDVQDPEEAEGRLVLELHHPAPVNSVAFSPDGALVATGGRDDRVGVWRFDSDEPIADFRLKGDVNAVAFHPSGRWVAAAGRSRTVRLWNLATGGPGPEIACEAPVQHALAFSPNGRRLAIGGSDGLVRFWTILP